MDEQLPKTKLIRYLNIGFGISIGGLVMIAIFMSLMGNELQDDIVSLRAGNVNAESLTYDKLDPDVFTATELQFPDGSIVTARILEAEIADGLLAGDVALTTESGEILSAKVIDAYQIEQGSVVEEMLSVDVSNKLNQISYLQLQDGTIITAKLADGSVTTEKLADEAVTTVKLIDGVITNSKLQSGVVWTESLADGSVTTIKIEDGTITDADISDTAAIAWAKLSKAGSSIADLETRDASDVDFADTNNYYTATDVEGALDEIGAVSYAMPTNYLKLDASNGPVTGQLGITVPTASSSGLVIQTTDDDTTNNLLEVQDSLGNLLQITADGRYVRGTDATDVSFITQGIGIADVARFQNSGGAAVVNIAGTGRLNTYGGLFMRNTEAIGSPTLQMQRASGQTSNLIQITDESSNPFMYLDSTGQLGVGNSAPQSLVHIGSAGTPNAVDGVDDLYVYDDVEIDGNLIVPNVSASSIGVNVYNGMVFNSTDAFLRAQGNQHILIDTDSNSTDAYFSVGKDSVFALGTELFRIQESGEVGIGTNSPGAKLHILGTSCRVSLGCT